MVLPARWHLYPTADALAMRACQIILRAAREAIAARGRFRLVLAGGATPLAVYAKLATSPADWGTWEIYFGDERCLPPEHAERNSRGAADAWLDHVAIPRSQIHPIPSERGPDAAAQLYSKLIESALPFDLVLLGLGEDGHTASLFPGRPVDEVLVIPVRKAPKPPPDRVSLSSTALSNTHQVFFLITGQNKQKAVGAWLTGKEIPASRISPAGGVDIFLDWAAWPPPQTAG